MSSTSKHSLRVRITKKPLALTLATVGVLMVGGNAVQALWADNAEMSTTITTGTVNIDVNNTEGNPVPQTITFPLSELKPGATTSQTVTVKNTGTLPVTLAMASSNEGGEAGLASALRAVLRLDDGIRVPHTLSSAAFTDRALNPGSSVKVYIEIQAPDDLPNTFQGLTDTVKFEFTATQRD